MEWEEALGGLRTPSKLLIGGMKRRLPLKSGSERGGSDFGDVRYDIANCRRY